jgi:bisphosphoglycerate-dependent phosphoglycerate mutase
MKTIKKMSPIPIKSAIIPTTTPTITEFQSNTKTKVN